MKCGHPDVMENLYWRRDERGHVGLSLGGVWVCYLCLKARNKAWQKANPESGRSAHAKWKANNKDKIFAYYQRNKKSIQDYHNEWRAKNPEKERSYNSKYYYAHREKSLAKSKAYFETIPGMYSMFKAGIKNAARRRGTGG
jgi:hypothetical protein